jgi:hypothetical protein
MFDLANATVNGTVATNLIFLLLIRTLGIPLSEMNSVAKILGCPARHFKN